MVSISGKTVQTRKITTIAVMAALIFVVTWLVKFPVPVSGGAYLNFGDIVIYMCAFILGGPSAAVAAAIGSCFADLAVGSAVYMLPTLIIKGLMGLAAGYLTKKQTFPAYVFACVVGGAIMTFGYALFEYLSFGASYAVASMPFNLIQWAGGAIVAVAFYAVVKRLSQYFNFRGTKPAPIQKA